MFYEVKLTFMADLVYDKCLLLDIKLFVECFLNTREV